MKELLNYFLMFTDNLNLSLQFVVDQLGIDPGTGEIGGFKRQQDLRMRRQIGQSSKIKAESERYKKFPMQTINDPGPGGSPVIVQET